MCVFCTFFAFYSFCALVLPFVTPLFIPPLFIQWLLRKKGPYLFTR
ncbi:hypothetical protein LL3_00951 [Bacillus amyloliquefaciens LL3]|nr:hypothetical protein LL3_00951 [Bacillus amyloliquefaciens LL3]